MAKTEVKYGWVIHDQASVVHGMSVGPGWLKGRSRTGPVLGGYHNLIGKDIVFHGKGKHALGAVVDQMGKMKAVKVRSGIREGMRIEKFVESEYGGGMDQITVEAKEEDIVRMPYRTYVFSDDGSAYHFNSLLSSFVSQATGFIDIADGFSALARATFESGATLYDKISGMIPNKNSDLQKALKSSKVFVILTSRKLHSRTHVAEHSHTHSVRSLGKDIMNAVMHGQ